jgi:hypothetical protein
LQPARRLRLEQPLGLTVTAEPPTGVEARAHVARELVRLIAAGQRAQ